MNDLSLYEKSRHTSTGIRFIGEQECRDFPLHWHEHLEIHFVLGGSVNVRCGNQSFSLGKHDCFIINSNELHSGEASADAKCFKFKLHPSFFDHKHYIFKHLVHDDTVTSLMLKIVGLYENTDDASLFTVKGYLFQLMGHLCAHFTTRTVPLSVQRQNSEKIGKMNTVASFMHANYTTEITTEELARMTHYNYSHFCHTFKEVFGMSVTKYLLSIRVNKAKALLSTTDMNVTEIAAAAGFSDANYFARAFKKETGLAPSAYREQFRR